jgi:transposase
VSASRQSVECGGNLGSNRTGRAVIWPVMIRSSKRKPRTSSACTSNHRGTAVFCVDEKSAIQALDRLDPVLPLSPGRAERHGFEYYRHGTLSLYGALNTQTGEVLAKASARHTSAEFVDFLAKIVDSQPPGREIHVIADNLSAHKTKKVFEFLEANPAVRIHYTPTYSSWLNQIEIWFSKIQRDVISRGVFTSVKDLASKLMRYIRNYNKTATPIRWIYKNVDHRINPAAI